MTLSNQQINAIKERANLSVTIIVYDHLYSNGLVNASSREVDIKVIEGLIFEARNRGFMELGQQLDFSTLAAIIGKRFWHNMPGAAELLDAQELSATERIQWTFLLVKEAFAITGNTKPPLMPGWGATFAHHFNSVSQPQVRRDTLYMLGMNTAITTFDLNQL